MTAEPPPTRKPDATAAERQRRRRQKHKLARELQFVRQDWALFLHPDRLAQKAGASVQRLRRMALKELADNAADVSAQVELEQLDDYTYRVGDEGPGLDCNDRGAWAVLSRVPRAVSDRHARRTTAAMAVLPAIRIETPLSQCPTPNRGNAMSRYHSNTPSTRPGTSSPSGLGACPHAVHLLAPGEVIEVAGAGRCATSAGWSSPGCPNLYHLLGGPMAHTWLAEELDTTRRSSLAYGLAVAATLLPAQ